VHPRVQPPKLVDGLLVLEPDFDILLGLRLRGEDEG